MLVPFRLDTLHAALAHFTIGGLPLILLAYTIAWRRRAAQWARIGDVALFVAASATLATCAFGLVSNARVPWPGGIETWRDLHLAGGMATTLLLAGLAARRVYRRARGAGVTPAFVGATVLVAGIVGATGWIGGEVLVFHAGVAVRAAGGGALAPPVLDSITTPADFLSAMREVRAAWGSITARLASMLVQRPHEEDFARIELDARRMQVMAQLMATLGTARARGGDTVTSMSQVLAGDALDLADAAHRRSLDELARALGETSAHCAACHEQTRW